MNIAIAEDEALAAERLQQLIEQHEPNAVIIDKFDSVQDTVQFLKGSSNIDLLFLDIQLADGKSFEIFDHVNIDVPIIFTTAYDQYALHAFKYYSIDYLLKPIQPDELKNALLKFRKLSESNKTTLPDIRALKELIEKSSKNYRERFVIKAGNKLQFKPVEEVAYFYADGKIVYLVTKRENRKYIVDHTLEELEKALDPSKFFRVSRKHIICVECIAEVKGLISGKLNLKLTQPADQDFSVSRERAAEFKSWLNR